MSTWCESCDSLKSKSFQCLSCCVFALVLILLKVCSSSPWDLRYCTLYCIGNLCLNYVVRTVWHGVYNLYGGCSYCSGWMFIWMLTHFEHWSCPPGKDKLWENQSNSMLFCTNTNGNPMLSTSNFSMTCPNKSTISSSLELLSNI